MRQGAHQGPRAAGPCLCPRRAPLRRFYASPPSATHSSLYPTAHRPNLVHGWRLASRPLRGGGNSSGDGQRDGDRRSSAAAGGVSAFTRYGADTRMRRHTAKQHHAVPALQVPRSVAAGLPGPRARAARRAPGVGEGLRQLSPPRGDAGATLAARTRRSSASSQAGGLAPPELSENRTLPARRLEPASARGPWSRARPQVLLFSCFFEPWALWGVIFPPSARARPIGTRCPLFWLRTIRSRAPTRAPAASGGCPR